MKRAKRYFSGQFFFWADNFLYSAKSESFITIPLGVSMNSADSGT